MSIFFIWYKSEPLNAKSPQCDWKHVQFFFTESDCGRLCTPLPPLNVMGRSPARAQCKIDAIMQTAGAVLNPISSLHNAQCLPLRTGLRIISHVMLLEHYRSRLSWKWWERDGCLMSLTVCAAVPRAANPCLCTEEEINNPTHSQTMASILLYDVFSQHQSPFQIELFVIAL